jgi:hypothetical protein
VKKEFATGSSYGGNQPHDQVEQDRHSQGGPGVTICDLVPYVAAKDEPGGEDGENSEVEVEVELDNEELAPSTFLAMARFYSGKRFNERGMFDEMRVAWGLPSLPAPRFWVITNIS